MDSKLLEAVNLYHHSKINNNDCEKQWFDWFKKLVKFKNENGHCNVPSSYKKDKKLAQWVGTQRRVYKNGGLYRYRLKLLEAIDFSFQLKVMHDWEYMFQQLKEHKEKCGVAHVKKSDKNKQLNRWLCNQKRKYWQGKMNGDHLLRLKELGVDMRNKNLNHWERNYKQLLEFKKKHGHLYICPTFTNDTKLIRFVSNIRENKNKLTKEQKAKLNKVGFDWKPGNEARLYILSQRADEQWLKRFELLKEYKSKNGNFNVPFKGNEYSGLAHWIWRQRKAKSTMPEKRFRLLHEIGFFEAKND